MRKRVTLEICDTEGVRIVSTENVEGQPAAANVETADLIKYDLIKICSATAGFADRKDELKALGYKSDQKTSSKSNQPTRK